MAAILGTIQDCKGCQQPRRIYSAKYCLCAFCNSKRLATGKPTKPRGEPKKPKKRIRQQSDNMKARKELLQTAKNAVRIRDAAKCSGCGRWYEHLSYSHIVPVGQNPKLEGNPRNIVFDCLTVGRVNPIGKNGSDLRGCHDIWEHGTKQDRERLLNFKERVVILEELAPELFNLWKLKNRI